MGSKHELLVGSWNYASKVVKLGESFLRRKLDKLHRSNTSKVTHHTITSGSTESFDMISSGRESLLSNGMRSVSGRTETERS